MKNPMIIFAFASMLAIAAGPAAANQDNAGNGAGKPSLEVSNSRGEHVGTIKQGLGDQYGNVIFAVLSIRDESRPNKDIVVPVSAFSKNGEGRIILDVDRSVLAAAPEFSLSQFSDPGYAEKVFRYYGQTPPWVEEETEKRK